INMAANAVHRSWSYYTMEKFGWTERAVGLSLGFVGALLMVVQAGLIRVIIPKLGLAKSILVGIILYVVSLLLYGVATETWMLYAISIPYVLEGIAGPGIQGYISNQIPTNEQGQIQDGITSVIRLTAIIGALLMTGLFYQFSKSDATVYFPGIPFLLGGFLALIALIIAIIYFRNRAAK